jgi:putative membrane protein insertion efficiency factor
LKLVVYLWRYVAAAFLPPASCKYHPSCSQYALDAVHKHGVVKGSLKAGWRILRCNPWSHGGVDYA